MEVCDMLDYVKQAGGQVLATTANMILRLITTRRCNTPSKQELPCVRVGPCCRFHLESILDI